MVGSSPEVIREMNEKLGIGTKTTLAESPFSNGIVERHSTILYEAMLKMLEDTNCEPDVAGSADNQRINISKKGALEPLRNN